MEKEIEAESSWASLFQDPVERHKLIFSCDTMSAQQINGIQFRYTYGVVFTESIGVAQPFTVWLMFISPYLYYFANLEPMLGFIYAGTTLFTAAYVWFRAGEKTGRTNPDIDRLFMGRVPVRKWRTYVVADEIDQTLEKGEKENIVQQVELMKV
jgi:hypothetical protein